MSVPAEGNQLVNVVVLLGAAVVAVPLFKRLGLGRCWGIWRPAWRSARSASASFPIPSPSCTSPSWAW